jgi:REP element-mobilizing transposase RayT
MGGSTYFITFRLRGGTRPRNAHRNRPEAPRPLSPDERQVVKGAILFWHGRKWTAHALTVMPDHVHILATPLEASKGRWHSLSTILHSVKSVSSLKINQLRRRRGPLWQSESFDRIVRNEKEFDEKANYILSNAVKARLVADGWKYDGFWCPGVEAESGADDGPSCQTPRHVDG